MRGKGGATNAEEEEEHARTPAGPAKRNLARPPAYAQLETATLESTCL